MGITETLRLVRAGEEIEDLSARGLNLTAQLQALADRAHAGKTEILASISAGEGVYDASDVTEIDARLSTVRSSIQAVLDKIAAAEALE